MTDVTELPRINIVGWEAADAGNHCIHEELKASRYVVEPEGGGDQFHLCADCLVSKYILVRDIVSEAFEPGKPVEEWNVGTS